jgi:hypothetical protein
MHAHRSLRDVSTNSKLELLHRPRSKIRKGSSATHYSVDCIGKTVAQLKATGKEADVARVELLEVRCSDFECGGWGDRRRI